MKVQLILYAALLNSFALFAQNNCLDNKLYADSTILYLNVDELPKFKSKKFDTALDYIYSNIKYPSEADVTGTVIVSFVVTKCGKIEKVRIEKGLYKECDNEVKMVLLSMPKWEAGKKNNKFVNTLLFLSINFKLQ